MIRLVPVLLLIGSNIFMTYAWYGHLRDLRGKPLLLVIVLSWGVAFFEYMLQIPANRIGAHVYSLVQLKGIQEIVSLSIFAAFAVFYMRERVTVDFL
ncbi:MAG: DMT family protein, partial [bacterium]